MSTLDNEQFLIHILDIVEQKEAKLLCWGIVETSMTIAEICLIIDEALSSKEFIEKDITLLYSNQIIDQLIKRCLIFDVGVRPKEIFRSRMAETVRLLFQLRQLFPRNDGDSGWQNAPTLVADFRFVWRRRRYPIRNISPLDAVKCISECLNNSFTESVISRLISFPLASFQVLAARRILSSFDGKFSSATLVSAGTGSGKTLSFYLPVLTRILVFLKRCWGKKMLLSVMH